MDIYIGYIYRMIPPHKKQLINKRGNLGQLGMGERIDAVRQEDKTFQCRSFNIIFISNHAIVLTTREINHI